MSTALRWLDGFATAAKLHGMSAAEIASALPEGSPLPEWITALERASSREARAAILAPHVAAIARALGEARPRWR